LASTGAAFARTPAAVDIIFWAVAATERSFGDNGRRRDRAGAAHPPHQARVISPP